MRHDSSWGDDCDVVDRSTPADHDCDELSIARPELSQPKRDGGVAARLAAVLVGAMAFTLGVFELGSKSYQYDEAFNVARGGWTWNELFHLVRYTEESQAIYLFGMKLWTGLGQSEELVRFPSVVAAALAAGLLVLLGERLFDLRVGVVAGILLASNAFVVQWSQNARTWALATFSVIAATLLVVRASRSGTWPAWLVYAIVAGLAVYTDFYIGLVVVAHALTVWLAPARIRRSQVVVCTAIFLFLVADAVRFTQRGSQFQVEWIPKPTPRLILDTLERLGGWDWLLIGTAIVGAVILVGVARRGWRQQSSAAAILVVSWAVIPLALAVLVSFALHPVFIARYAIVVTPALALLAAVTISRIWSRNRLLALGLVGALLAVSGVRIENWYSRTPEDWRGAAAYIRRASPPEKSVSVTPTWAVDALETYLPGSWRNPDLRAPRRYVLALSSEGGSPSRVAARFVDTPTYQLVAQEPLSERLWVTVWERRRP